MLNETSMNKKYGASHMRELLEAYFTVSAATFETKGVVTAPSFYTCDHAIIFPPSSDTQGTMEEALGDVLANARQHLQDKAITNKVFLFPVVEEQVITLFGRRNHWVTLHYDPRTKTATLIDSRPYIFSMLYGTKAIESELRRGLIKWNMELDTFCVKYQEIQWDDIHCGAWTAENLRQLSGGCSIDQLMRALSTAKINDMIQGHVNQIAGIKPNSPTSTRSTDSLSAFSLGDEDNFDLIEGNLSESYAEAIPTDSQALVCTRHAEQQLEPDQVGRIKQYFFNPNKAILKPEDRVIRDVFILALLSLNKKNAMSYYPIYRYINIVINYDSLQLNLSGSEKHDSGAPLLIQDIEREPNLQVIEEEEHGSRASSIGSASTISMLIDFLSTNLIYLLDCLIYALNWVLNCVGAPDSYQVKSYNSSY